jgi:hypothetical protein
LLKSEQAQAQGVVVVGETSHKYSRVFKICRVFFCMQRSKYLNLTADVAQQRGMFRLRVHQAFGALQVVTPLIRRQDDRENILLDHLSVGLCQG